jgi:MFS-type transporter involved in bile tolerance (Atg22 family)
MEKLSIVLGAAMYGIVNDLTGSLRNSLIVFALLFLAGIALLSWLRYKAPAGDLEKIRAIG